MRRMGKHDVNRNVRTFVFCVFLLWCFCTGCASTLLDEMSELTRLYREGRRPETPSELKSRVEFAANRHLVYGLLKKKILNEGKRSVSFIRELLRKRDDSLCILGCTTAGEVKDYSLVEPLLALLTDKNKDVSAHAAYALIAIGQENRGVGKRVLRKLRILSEPFAGTEQLEWGKMRCIYVLRKLSVGEAVDDVIKALVNNSQRVRISAVDALAEMHVKDAVPHIISLLRARKDKPIVRRRCIVALGELGAVEAADEVIAGLWSPDEEMRWVAAMAFRKIKAPRVIPTLIGLVARESRIVSSEAIRALYFQTGQKLTRDFLRTEAERDKAEAKWHAWWEKNKDKSK